MFLPPRLRTRLTLVESAHERRQSIGERVRGNISECRPQPVRECQRELIESPESRTEHHKSRRRAASPFAVLVLRRGQLDILGVSSLLDEKSREALALMEHSNIFRSVPQG